MHKKLATDLTSLAHSILQMKNKEDVLALKEKAYEVYEKLSVLAYVEEYINTTPNVEVTKEELIEKVIKASELKEKVKTERNLVAELSEEKQLNEVITELDEKEQLNEITKEQIVPDLDKEEQLNKISKERIVTELDEKEQLNEIKKEQIVPDLDKEEQLNKISKEDTVVKLDEELQLDEVANEIAEDIIESIAQEVIVKEEIEQVLEQPFDELQNLLFSPEELKSEEEEIKFTRTPQTLEEELKDTISVDEVVNLFEKIQPKKSLNDRLQNTIQIDLNDRIAFVKHLFEGNQGDFNRVISQLNTFKTEKEAKRFVNKMVKPDYNWSDKEEYEIRLIDIIERRFT